MEIIKANDPKSVTKAAEVLHAGGVMLYPTDTLYGLGADALSDAAVAKVYAIKARDENKPMHAIVADLRMANQYGDVNEMALALASAYMPGPLTLILKKKAGIETGIAKSIDTIGIRMPDSTFCLNLAAAFGKPYTTTSANGAGMQPERSVEKILTQLGEKANDIDLVIDAGELPEQLPSTIVDVTEHSINVLREGAIPKSVFQVTG